MAKWFCFKDKVEMAEAETNSNGSVFLRSLHLEGQRLELLKQESEPYPDMSEFVKTCKEYPAEDTVRVAVSAERLENMIRAIRYVLGKDERIILTVRRPGNRPDGTTEKYSTSPVVFDGEGETDGTKVFAILMPIRVE